MEDPRNRVARRRRAQAGFTLIELLVVIAILGILAAIVVFNVTGVKNRGTTAACQTDLSTIQSASDAYYSDFNSYPTSFTQLEGDNLIHSAPTDLGSVTWGSVANGGKVTSSACTLP
jgi:type II secretion system protein G